MDGSYSEQRLLLTVRSVNSVPAGKQSNSSLHPTKLRKIEECLAKRFTYGVYSQSTLQVADGTY